MEEIKASELLAGTRDRWREEKNWLEAAAGDAELAEELRTGRCRCGKLIREDSAGCRRHERGRERIAESLRTWVRLSVRDSAGPRGEDLDLLARYLPRDFMFCYEVLVHRGVAIPGSAVRGGQGYDETAVTGIRPRGGLGSSRSGEPELRLAASGRRGSQGSGKAVIRDEEAVLYRARIDRRLRKMAREILGWLEEGRTVRTTRRCTGKKCRRLAEEGWVFCPACGASVSDGPR